MMRFESRIAGIPCLIEVRSLEVHRPYRGSAHTCDSDTEYYGYTDCEFDVFDRRGRPADWLASKMTDADENRIIHEAKEYMRG